MFSRSVSVVKTHALRNGVKSLRSDVSTPCWVETGEAGRIGAAEGISGCVIFADFSSRTPGKIYRKNSDSPRLRLELKSRLSNNSICLKAGYLYLKIYPAAEKTSYFLSCRQLIRKMLKT